MTREVSTIASQRLSRELSIAFNLERVDNSLNLQILKCMTSNTICEIFFSTSLKINVYSKFTRYFFSQVRFGLVYISISINIYTTAFQNECQALTEPN